MCHVLCGVGFFKFIFGGSQSLVAALGSVRGFRAAEYLRSHPHSIFSPFLEFIEGYVAKGCKNLSRVRGYATALPWKDGKTQTRE